MSQLNFVLTDYKKVREEYNQYYSQYYSQKVLTITGCRDSIAGLTGSLNYELGRITYLKQLAPANASTMTQKLDDSITDFHEYIKLLVDSLKASNPTEANRALPYLTKSNQAWQEFNTLR